MDIADLMICILAQEVARLRQEVQRLQAHLRSQKPCQAVDGVFKPMVALMQNKNHV